MPTTKPMIFCPSVRPSVWRKKLTEKVDPQSGEKILDIAAGTGTSSMALKLPGVEVVAADFSKGMLAEGKKALSRAGVRLRRCNEIAL